MFQDISNIPEFGALIAAATRRISDIDIRLKLVLIFAVAKMASRYRDPVKSLKSLS